MSDLDEKRAEAIGDALLGEESGYCSGYEGCGSLRIDREYRSALAEIARDADTAAIVAEGGRILTADALPEWCCPNCGHTTRARMADR